MSVEWIKGKDLLAWLWDIHKALEQMHQPPVDVRGNDVCSTAFAA